MSAGWVAASVRARLLLRRRVGRERAAQIARGGSLREAIASLGPTAYGRELQPDHDLEEAQRAVAARTLLHLRLLAGWLPPGGSEVLRALAAWWELANLEDRLAYLQGAELRPSFELGSLASAWPAASQALDSGELRRALAGSAWGDPGELGPDTLPLVLRASWAGRVAGTIPELRMLVAGALALLVAREVFVTGRSVDLLPVGGAPGLGARWQEAGALTDLAAALPPQTAWALDGIEAPEDLWRAELAWWRRAEHEGARLARTSLEGYGVVAGVALLLAADTWLVAAALASADTGGAGLEEVLRVAA